MKIKVIRNLLEIFHLKYYLEKKVCLTNTKCVQNLRLIHTLYTMLFKNMKYQVLPDLLKFINN